MKLKRENIIIGFLVFLVLITALSLCYNSFFKIEREDYRIVNIRIYEDTPAWNLAKAVKRQDTSAIKKITKKNPELLDYRDPLFGTTLLIWSVGTEKYKSAEALLKCGANPDIICRYNGRTALYQAAGFSWVDNFYKEDPKYVKLLLNYGADPNINFAGHTDPNYFTAIGESPLMHSIGCSIEKTKALVEGGADINYQTKDGKTAALQALMYGGPTTLLKGLEYAHFLIVEKHADITKPWIRRPFDEPPSEVFPVEILQRWIFDLDSDRHKLKMEIVKEFERQGVHYREIEIPEYTLKEIQERYPDTWEEYIKNY